MGNEKSVHMAHDYDDGNPYAPPRTQREGEEERTHMAFEGGLSFEFREPKLFKWWHLLLFDFWFVFWLFALCAGVFVDFLGIGFIIKGVDNSTAPIVVAFVILDGVVIAVTYLYYPKIAMLNDLIARKLKSVREKIPHEKEVFLVQVMFTPRSRGGMPIDETDDYGFLYFEENVIRFEGDSCRFTIPCAVIVYRYDNKLPPTASGNYNIIELYPQEAKDFTQHSRSPTQIAFGTRDRATAYGTWQRNKLLEKTLQQWKQENLDFEFKNKRNTSTKD